MGCHNAGIEVLGLTHLKHNPSKHDITTLYSSRRRKNWAERRLRTLAGDRPWCTAVEAPPPPTAWITRAMISCA